MKHFLYLVKIAVYAYLAMEFILVCIGAFKYGFNKKAILYALDNGDIDV